MEKPLNHPDYAIPGTNAFSLSKWKRENDPAPPPTYKAGDVVTVTFTAEIIQVYEDCDGTPLYELSSGGNGWSEENMRPATAEEEMREG